MLSNPVQAQTRRCPILGVGISAVTPESALARLDEWIQTREKTYVCITGVHGVMESQKDPQLKRILNGSGMSTPDGMPMVWLSWLHGCTHVRRVYGPTFMREACKRGVARDYKHFLYGGRDGVAHLLSDKLKEANPGIQIVGTHTPPFRSLSQDEEQQIVTQINDSGADIVWVGLSTPKQEHWMARYRERLNAPVLVGVGAAFDFLAGLKSQAPRFMQVVGMEWFYRMVTEPRRLAGRYLKNNPLFCMYLLLQALHLKNFQSDDAPAAQ